MGKIYFSLPELNNSAQGSQINTLLAKFPGTALKKPFFLKKDHSTAAASDETSQSGLGLPKPPDPNEKGRLLKNQESEV